VPIETKLMDVAMMSERVVAWVNSYHATVRERVVPRLEGKEQALAWVHTKTEPITK